MTPPRHVNGRPVDTWAPRMALAGPSRPPADRPTCPKHCDVATPPEHGGGDQYVCAGCGSQFTWKGPPP